MADIFISYAQKAREPTQALAADLAALKYSEWFDQRLLPVEKFGQVINHELDAAKAVITIWSEPALKSEWVYAEAIRANDTKKLKRPSLSPSTQTPPDSFSARFFGCAHIAPMAEGFGKSLFPVMPWRERRQQR